MNAPRLLVTLAAIAGTSLGATFHSRGSLRASSLKPQAAANGEHPAFKKVKAELVAEYDMNFTLYKHIATGAEVLSVESDETNKVFGIAFRTPATDNTGVPHIMEHSVLCGSKKYPVKDPFIQLRRTSLQTYLNAFTYPDRTVYPVASQNLKDFYNLANVYLDAVLHPRAVEDPMVLAQEGWHLDLEKVDAPLIFKGIVYNEMKGAYSAPDERLHREAMRKLFPNTTYRFDSAGDPMEIPALTLSASRLFTSSTTTHPMHAFSFSAMTQSMRVWSSWILTWLSLASLPCQRRRPWSRPRPSGRRPSESKPITQSQPSRLLHREVPSTWCPFIGC